MMRLTAAWSQFASSVYAFLGGLGALGLAACSGDAQYVSRLATCGPLDRHERFVVSGYTLPASPGEITYDIDGDGRPENQFGNLVQTANGFNFFDFKQEVDTAVSQGRGELLMDLQSSSIDPTCMAVAINVAMMPSTPPKYDGTDSISTQFGESWVVLPASQQGEVIITDTSDRTPTAQPPRVDLFLGVHSWNLYFALYSPVVQVRRFPDGHIEGQLNGALRPADVDRTLTLPISRTVAEFIQAHASDSSTVGPPIEQLEQFANGQCTSDRKQGSGAMYCCHNDATHCRIYPEELRSRNFISGSLSPDVQVFSSDGWHPTPSGPNKDGISMGLGFRAVPATHIESCPAGSFCKIPGQSNTGPYWAFCGTGMNDVWVGGDAGTMRHFDGVNWTNTGQAGGPQFSGCSANAQENAIATAFSGVGFWRWDGYDWNVSPPIANTGEYLTSAIPFDDRSVVGAYDGSYTSSNGLVYSYVYVYDTVNKTYTIKKSTSPNLGSGVSGLIQIGSHVWGSGKGGLVIDCQLDTSVNMFTCTNGPKLATTAMNFLSIWGSASDDLWIVGDGGACRHWNGLTWEANLGCNGMESYQHVWGFGRREVWTADGKGHIRFLNRSADPNGWVEISSNQTTLNGVWGSGPGEVWTGGDSGEILRYQPPQ